MKSAFQAACRPLIVSPMKSIRLGAVLLLLAALLILPGCATPASRIKKNPKLFDRLAPEVQTNVQAGRIEVGYSQDAVMLALGEPNRRYSRKTGGDKTIEVWSYTSSYTTTSRQRVDARVRARDSDGRMRTFSDWVDVAVDQQHEYERLRVELENGLVTAIETLER